jgi:hypothetical protein
VLICKKCNTEVEKYANGRECRDCYNERMRVYMAARYHRRRAEAIALLGGKCIDCGTAENLEFDHHNRSQKTYDVSSQHGSKFWSEIKKCVLRCRTCHQIKSAREAGVEHGGGKSGKKNCKCDPCKARKREYMRNWEAADLIHRAMTSREG